MRWLRRVAEVLCPAVCVLFAYGPPAAPQVATGANQIYRTPEGRQREAFEMDHPHRWLLEETTRLVASLGIAPGDVVADVGTGVGYLLPHLVAAVGPKGRIIAEDIYPDLLSTAEEKTKDKAWANVDVILGTEQNPKLPAGVLDVALAVDVYHHFDYPVQMLGQIRQALKPKGRLIIVEFYVSRPHPRASEKVLREHLRLDRDGVAQEVEENGFRRLAQFDHFPYQYVLVFGKR